jgi:hypothetical protein
MRPQGVRSDQLWAFKLSENAELKNEKRALPHIVRKRIRLLGITATSYIPAGPHRVSNVRDKQLARGTRIPGQLHIEE